HSVLLELVRKPYSLVHIRLSLVPKLPSKASTNLGAHQWRSDGQEFYQLLSYKGDVDLEAKLDEWERFYSFYRPHGAHNGKTPYEALRDKL
ncbi:MAG: hypothetical protein P8Q92_04115, partial [Pseudoprimorskyibacter sp.]|nr:hypothetical protein [Pseudoprimorskyibacter sp.]